MTINEAIDRVQDHSMSIAAAAEMFAESYALQYFSPDSPEQAATLRQMREEAARLSTAEPVAVASESTSACIGSVRCTCGHEVASALVMSASTGTACPDCYDEMSDR